MKTRKGLIIKRIILGAVLLLVVIAAAGFLYWNSNKEQIVRKKIEQAVAGKSGLYRVDFTDMQLDELKGYISLDNMVIRHDSAKFVSYKDSSNKPPALYHLKVPKVRLEGVKTPKAMLGKELIARKLTVTDPEITVSYLNTNNNAPRNLPGSETWRVILQDLKLVQVDTIEISGATIRSESPGGRTEAVFHNSYIRLTDFRIDSAHYHAPGRLAFSDHMIFRSEKLNWTESNKWYDFDVTGVSFDSKADLLKIARVSVNPILNEVSFINAHPQQTDRIATTLKNVSFRGIDPEHLSDEKIIAEELRIGSISMNIYRDLTKPRDAESKIGTYPHQQIKHIPLTFSIKKAIVEHADIAYKEKSDLTGKTATVRFENSSISVSNFTNDKALLKKNNQSTVNIKTSFMGIAPLQARLNLVLGDPSGNFSISGTGGKIPGGKLNILTEPMGPVRIREGELEKLEFKLKGNNTHASGVLTMYYNGLKLDLLEQDAGGEFNKKRFTSILANKMIDDANPLEGESVRTAAVNHSRDVTRSFYNLIWKSLLSGINTTIGNKRPVKRP